MKKLLYVLIIASMSVMAHGENGGTPPDPVVENLQDRVDGTYALECNGYRVDGPSGQLLDWTIRKDQMSYLWYGVMSHSVLEAINELYAKGADKALRESGVMPQGLPVPGITVDP